jgi:Putative adhesin
VSTLARWAWTGTGLVLAGSAIVFGAADVTSLLWLRSRTTTAAYPVGRSVDVESGCGSVTVRAASSTSGSTGQVQVRSHIIWSFAEPTVSTTTRGSTTVIRVNCPGFSLGNEGTADLTVTVPATENVAVDSSGGDAQVSGVSGAVSASSSGGDIDVADLSGQVTLDTSAGSVDATGLTSDQLTARSSAGDVIVGFASPPGKVVATSSAGDVRILLPHAAATYHVTVSSSAGSTSIGVPTDPASARTIDASSSAGDVDVTYGS